MLKIIILHSTVDGQTRKICHYIRDELAKSSLETNTTIHALHESSLIELAQYDVIILGASIRYGKHRKAVYDFVSQNQSVLTKKQTAFFSVNLVARKDEKNTANTNPYVIKFLQETEWQPTVVDVFAGKLDYAVYSFFDKLMIKLIMWLTKGPTRSEKPIEFTNWLRVRAFVKKIVTLNKDH